MTGRSINISRFEEPATELFQLGNNVPLLHPNVPLLHPLPFS